jgi:hypothetical protein
MRAIHFICKRDNGHSLNNLHFDKSTGLYRSGNWNVSDETAQSLVGGWLYLHATKTARSEFGGRIIGFEPIHDPDVARSDRIIFLVRKEAEGSDQEWRGQSHMMAHSSGVIDADFTHEMASADRA